MGRTCKICAHQRRAAIESELLAGEPLRNVAAVFGVSSSALHRHKAHIRLEVRELATRHDELRREALLKKLLELAEKAEQLADRMESKNPRQAVAALSEARQCLVSLINYSPKDVPVMPNWWASTLSER